MDKNGIVLYPYTSNLYSNTYSRFQYSTTYKYRRCSRAASRINGQVFNRADRLAREHPERLGENGYPHAF
jgi:response regulator RpfG family c-di-GMP phosphodiesterase